MSYNKEALRVDLGKYYKPDPYKKDIITDPAGQWKYPGQPTRIPGNKITMQGVPYPVYGQDDQGNGQMMYPGEEYVFPGNYVDEYPQMKVGGIPELPLTAGRKAYRAWGYTNNDFIVNRQKGGEGTCEDGRCEETDMIQNILDEGSYIPKKNINLMWDVAETRDSYNNAKKIWTDKGAQVISKRLGNTPAITSYGNCMWSAGLGYQCLPETKGKIPLMPFESNDKFINAVNKGTVPFSRVAKTHDPNFASQETGMLQQGDIINFKGGDSGQLSHAMTFSHYREDGAPIFLDSNGQESNFHWNKGLWDQLVPNKNTVAYVSRFSPEMFYKDKIKALEEKARTNPTMIDESIGTLPVRPVQQIEGYAKGGYIVEDISVPQLTKAQIGLIKNPYHMPAGVQHPMQVAPKSKKVPVKYKPKYDPLLDSKVAVSESTKPTQTFNPNLNIKDAVKEKKDEREVAAYLVSVDPLLSEKDKVKILSDPKKIDENIYRVYQENDNEIKQVAPQSKASRVWEYATNPLTALKYSITTGDMSNMPHNINRMRMDGIEVDPHNLVGNTLNDFYNLVDAGDKVVRYTADGDLLNAGLEGLRFMPGARLTTGLGKKVIDLGRKSARVVGNPILRNFLENQSKYFKPKMHTLENIPTAEELARMNEIERASSVNTYNRMGDAPRVEDFGSIERFLHEQERYNQQLKTVQNYLKNSGLDDADIQRVFGRSREEILNIKPVMVNPADVSMNVPMTTSAIDLRRQQRVAQLQNQGTQLAAPPQYIDLTMPTNQFAQTAPSININQAAINNITNAARGQMSSGQFNPDVLTSLPERLNLDQYNQLNRYYEGMLDTYNIDPSDFSHEDWTLMNDIYNRLSSNYDLYKKPKFQKIKRKIAQAKSDAEYPINPRDIQDAFHGKRDVPGLHPTDNSGNIKYAVPSFYARDFQSPREALDFVTNKLDEGFKNSKVGDVITGSTNTSHDSYRVQMDYIFKNAGKNGLSDPIFLGYKQMNDSGFLTNAGIDNADIIKKINADLNKLQKRTGKNINLKTHPPMLETTSYGTRILLPQYGVRKLAEDVGKLRKKKEGGSIELELSPDEIKAYQDQGYTIEYLD